MRTAYSATILCLLLAAPALTAGDAETTRKRVLRYGKELAEAWAKFATEAQKNVRSQTISDINQQFTRDITKCDAATNEKMMQVYSNFLKNLDRADEFFRLEKMNTERSQYVKACSTAFKREFQLATDFAEPRTAQKCYAMLLDMLTQARDQFVLERTKDLRAEGFTAVQQAFNDLMRTAKSDENVDHAEQMDKNIKDAKARFPVATALLAVKNQQPFQMCEAAAKLIKQKSMQAQR